MQQWFVLRLLLLPQTQCGSNFQSYNFLLTLRLQTLQLQVGFVLKLLNSTNPKVTTMFTHLTNVTYFLVFSASLQTPVQCHLFHEKFQIWKEEGILGWLISEVHNNFQYLGRGVIWNCLDTSNLNLSSLEYHLAGVWRE